MVDVADSKSAALHGRAGSSPATGTSRGVLIGCEISIRTWAEFRPEYLEASLEKEEN